METNMADLKVSVQTLDIKETDVITVRILEPITFEELAEANKQVSEALKAAGKQNFCLTMPAQIEMDQLSLDGIHQKLLGWGVSEDQAKIVVEHFLELLC